MITCFLNKKMFIHLLSGKKGQYVWTDCVDEEALSKGVYNTYTSKNLRYSQVGQFHPTHMICINIKSFRWFIFKFIIRIQVQLHIWTKK